MEGAHAARCRTGRVTPVDRSAAGREHGVVAPVPVDPTGRTGPTRREAAGPGWRRSSRGLYVPTLVPETVEQRIVEVAAPLCSPTLAVTGWANLRWRGSRWFGGLGADGRPRPVVVVGSGHQVRAGRAFRLVQEAFGEDDADVVDGVRLVRATAAVTFAMRHAPSLAAAVEALDLAYADDLVSPEEVLDQLTADAGRRGVRQAREAWRLADENAWSPQEVHQRLRWQPAVDTPLLTNRPVFDQSGRHLGTPDVLDPLAGVGGDYDGDHHLDRAQRQRDLAREDALRSAGLELFTVVAGDLRSSGPFQDRRREAYLRAARLPASEQRWTLTPPEWWVETHTVSRRRALPPHLLRTWHPRYAGRRARSA